jgi:hypothetical protein
VQSALDVFFGAQSPVGVTYCVLTQLVQAPFRASHVAQSSVAQQMLGEFALVHTFVRHWTFPVHVEVKFFFGRHMSEAK